jgi:type VI secretion system secreted protein Hcp
MTGATGASRRRGGVLISDFVMVKEIDKSSPKLFESMTQGKKIPQVIIQVTASFTDAGRVPYLQYELKNVLITSYTVGGSGQSEGFPVDTFTLNFEEIKYSYTQYSQTGKSEGTVEATWKVEEGEA